MITDFTLQAYQDFLIKLKKTHVFQTFKEYKESSDSKKIVLRHDIDYSLAYAYEMAKLEHSLGVKSTYFLLFSSEYYNMLDEKNIALAKKIVDLGHEVGLHYDVKVMQLNGHVLPLTILKQHVHMLSVLIGSEIKSMAMHNPSINGEDIFKEFPLNNAYSSIFLQRGAYFSDSCMAWRNEFIDCYKSDTFPDKFQLLIHPILWTKERLSRLDKLDVFESIKREELKKDVDFSRAVFKNHSGVREHDHREGVLNE